MSRLFIAIPLSDEVKARLATYRPARSPLVRPVREAHLHVTLRFVGEGQPEALHAALETVRGTSFTLKGTRLGVFGAHRGHGVLWAGVERSEPLTALHQAIETALEEIGYPPEKRAFSPHITLARLRRGDTKALVAAFLAQESAAWEMEVDAFCLFSSRLRPQGPLHSMIGRYRLDR